MNEATEYQIWAVHYTLGGAAEDNGTSTLKLKVRRTEVPDFLDASVEGKRWKGSLATFDFRDTRAGGYSFGREILGVVHVSN